MLTALARGVHRFDASIGGLGGCPYAPGATGNVVTEDLVHMLDDMEIDTGVDLDALIECAHLAQELVGRELPGQVMRSGPRTPAWRGGEPLMSAEEVRKHTDRALQGNLEKDREKLAGQNKRFVRDRLARLLDPGSFVEDGLLANALADRSARPTAWSPASARSTAARCA